MFRLAARLNCDPRASDTPSTLSIAPSSQSIDHSQGHLRVIGFGRIAERDASAGQALTASDAGALIIRLWQSHGAGFVERIRGEFALVIHDASTGEAVAVVDRFNSFPLFHARAGNSVAIASSPLEVARALGLSIELDASAILAYCYFHVIPAPLSILRGVHRLDIGGVLRLRNGQAPEEHCWLPRFDEHQAFDFESNKRAFLDALDRGVEESAAGVPDERLGCFLSGGTDSSTIAGLLSRQRGRGARSFSIAFGVDGYDESYYSRLAASHFGTRHTEHVLTPADAIHAVNVIARSYEQPFGNSSAVPTLICAELAASAGVTRLLGGDGGDELYGGNDRYAKQWIFGLYDNAPRLLRGALESALFGPLASSRQKLFAKARGYIEQTRVPLPDRLQAKYNLLDRFGRDQVLSPGVLGRAQDCLPEAMAREVYRRADAHTQINRLLAFDFKYTLGDNDLPKVTRMCHAAGVEVAFPMLTDALVTHSLALAPGQKLHRTQLRFFFKNALRGFLPDEIITKTKHGFGMPFGDWLITRPEMQAMADDALSSLAGRGFIQPSFVTLLRDEVRAGHAGYFGTMVWVLMTLELWLREHIPDARG